MHSLTEIESVVDRLPVAEQEELLRHLEANLRNRRSESTSVPRAQWMGRLEALRNAIGNGVPRSSSEQILAELRED